MRGGARCRFVQSQTVLSFASAAASARGHQRGFFCFSFLVQFRLFSFTLSNKHTKKFELCVILLLFWICENTVSLLLLQMIKNNEIMLVTLLLVLFHY